MKKPGKEVDRSTNLLPHSQATTATKDDYDDSNFSNQSKYKKFTNFLKESKEAKQQNKKTKQLECNCWVCKILDSVTTDDKTSTAQYEPYNIVSETGDSIFYDPLISSIFNNEEEEDKSKREGQIYIAVDRILDFVQQDELLAKHINGVNLNKNEY